MFSFRHFFLPYMAAVRLVVVVVVGGGGRERISVLLISTVITAFTREGILM
jgi:hypothetical protein